MRRKYTMSKDGRKRCNVSINIRLTEEEVDKVSSMSKKLGFNSFKKWAEKHFGVEWMQIYDDYDFKILGNEDSEPISKWALE